MLFRSNIFFLRKGAEGKVSILAPHDGPSFSFTISSDGTEQWTNENVWDTIRDQTQEQVQDWVGSRAAELLQQQWKEGDVRLRWRRSAKRFCLLVIIRPPLDGSMRKGSAPGGPQRW